MKKSADNNLSEDINKFLNEEDFDFGGAEPEAPEGSPEDIAAGQKVLDSYDRRIFDTEEEDWEIQLEDAMIEETPAVILLGESGVGKTTLINQLASKFLSTHVAYFNAPTMDPFIHLVGVPEVSQNEETKEKVLAFVRKSGIEGAELLVLDEINRVPPETQNALFELVATRMINGEKFGKLKMVWGAMNPPRSDIEGRSVEDIEDAFRGRFHKVVEVLAKPKHHHFNGRNGIGAHVARICLRWWYQFIEHGKEGDIQFKDIVTPRVLEYIMVTIQKLENRKSGKGDPRQRPLTPRIWNANFDTACKHHKLSKDTTGITLPFTQLKQAFLGKELYALSSLMDNSSEIEAKIAEIQNPDDPEAGKMAASVILDGIKGTRLRPNPLVAFYRIGEFSRVLTTMRPDDANIIISGKPEIAGYLFAKCAGNDQIKRDYSKGNMEHPVWQKATQGEMAIFNHLKYPITRAVKQSASFAKPAAAAPGAKPGVPGATPGKPGAAPGVPPKKPGVP